MNISVKEHGAMLAMAYDILLRKNPEMYQALLLATGNQPAGVAVFVATLMAYGAMPKYTEWAREAILIAKAQGHSHTVIAKAFDVSQSYVSQTIRTAKEAELRQQTAQEQAQIAQPVMQAPAIPEPVPYVQPTEAETVTITEIEDLPPQPQDVTYAPQDVTYAPQPQPQPIFTPPPGEPVAAPAQPTTVAYTPDGVYHHPGAPVPQMQQPGVHYQETDAGYDPGNYPASE